MKKNSFENGVDEQQFDKHCSNEALKKFRLVFRAVQQHSQVVENRIGVSSAQLWILSELADNPGSKVTEIANTLSIHHSTASNLLVKLEKKGLIVRERICVDQRIVSLKLTAEGIKVLNEAPRPLKGKLQQALFELPKPITKQLVENLEVLISQMQIDDADSALQPFNPFGKGLKKK